MKDRYVSLQVSDLKNKLGDASTADALNEIQKTLQSIKSSVDLETFENKSVKDYLPTFVEKYRSKKENPDFEKGIMTGFSYLDAATNGLLPSDFILVSGSSGSGKSVVLNALSTSIWMGENKITDTEFKKGASCIYFSLEMPYEQCHARFIAGLAGVPSRSIENATLTKSEFARLKQALDFIKRYPYEFRIVDLADATVSDIGNVLDQCNQNYDLITCDYLNIIKSSGNEDSDWLSQGMISYDLRKLVRGKRKSIMLTGNQLNRANNNSDKIGLHRLSRSGTVATNCTLILQIEDRENETKYADMSLHIIKNRRGSKGNFSVLKNLANCQLTDIPIETEENSDFENRFTDYEDISDSMEDLDF